MMGYYLGTRGGEAGTRGIVVHSSLVIRHRRGFSHRTSLLTGSRGQAQVEFVLSILFLLIFIFGIFEMTMFVYTYNVLADSAKEGVRYAIVHGSDSSNASGPGCADSSGTNVQAVVNNYAEYSFHDVSGMTVTTKWPDSSCVAPSRVRVTVSYPYKPLLNLGWPTVTVNAAAEGRIVY